MDKTKSDGGCNAASENNRKRHCSATPLDESPKKKILFSEAPEVDKSSNLIKSGLKAASEEHDRHTNAGELQSLFFLGELCDEILYEIFKYLDTWSLMSLMNVCERFRTFVLDKRLWTNIDLSKEPLPLGILEDMLERSHEKTKCIKLRGPSTSQHIDREIDHFTKTIKISFALRCVKLVTLELYSVTLDFDQDMGSDSDTFHPNETSTAFSHFSGIENFKAPHLPTAMHHFICRVVTIITPTTLQIFPVHNEFRYRDVDLQRSIKEYVKLSLPPLTTFEPRSACLACYSKDKHWYRAVIRSYNPTAKTVDVLYVDYFNNETLPLKYVRQCPKELLAWPLRTFCVSLHGIEVNRKVKENEVRLSLQKLLNKRELFAVVKKHPISTCMVFTKEFAKSNRMEIVLYESKEASLKGITVYEPLIEKKYYKRL